MNKNPTEREPDERKDRRETYETKTDRLKEQGERPRHRVSMAEMQAGQRFTSDEDIVRGRKR